LKIDRFQWISTRALIASKDAEFWESIVTAAINSRIVLRPMTLDDVPLLDRWDQQPHVIAATSDDPHQPKAFGNTYWPDELALVAPDYQYLIAELAGRPIGALQIIDPCTESTHYWRQIEPNLRAIDIWIGAAEDLGRGYGETMMRRAFQLCFANPDVVAIVIDPLSSNLRAHKFYQRLGFVPEDQRTFGDDDCLVHRLTRQTWRERFPTD
jgi:aminoglycoside 6'-N-acetyltransferase